MQFFWQRLEQISLRLTPAALTVLMVLFAAVPLHVPGAGQVMPAFTLINIYYWGIFLPGALPYAFLFLLGFLQDALMGTPLLFSSAINIAFALLLTTERRIFGQNLFGTVWLGFATLSSVVFLLAWVVMSLRLHEFLPVFGLLLQWGVTCLAYPLLHLLLTRVYRWIR